VIKPRIHLSQTAITTSIHLTSRRGLPNSIRFSWPCKADP
jgi:hypothetical protein